MRIFFVIAGLLAVIGVVLSLPHPTSGPYYSTPSWIVDAIVAYEKEKARLLEEAIREVINQELQ
ncbi:hypothetical protein Bhyg_15473 [Pseudolycoriella hygida]|uniref:Uncharacterized protein n=1 Tax=Pseudolycoriella hygida TaxID=35572 RepID=A0A9Q0MH90_9DIPT|nr:hypothetical protein Bhyg_15473 [Pseudolycoriella hygida]